jgi:hypothetical protein
MNLLLLFKINEISKKSRQNVQILILCKNLSIIINIRGIKVKIDCNLTIVKQLVGLVIGTKRHDNNRKEDVSRSSSVNRYFHQ